MLAFVIVMMPLLWLGCAFGAVGIQQSKGKSGCVGLLLVFLLGPIGLLLCLLDGSRACPYCRSAIHPDAVKCPRCQSEVLTKWQEDIERDSARMQARAERAVRREQQPGWLGDQMRRLKAWHEEWKSRP